MVQELEAFVQRAEGVSAKQQSLEAQRRWLESITPPEEARVQPAPEEAVRCLYDWLALGAEQPAPPSWMRTVALSASILAAFAGLLALLLNHSVFGALALLCGLAAFIFLLLSARQAAPRTTRSELERHFAEFHLEGFAAWTEPGVQQFLRDTAAHSAARELAAKTAEKQRELELAAGELQQQLPPLEAEKARIAGKLGIDPARAYSQGNSALFYFVTQLTEWQRKHARTLGAQAELEKLSDHLQRQLAVANAKLAPFGYPPAAGSGELRGMLTQLGERKHGYLQAEGKRKNALRNKEEQENQLLSLHSKRFTWLERLHLPADPEEALRQLTLLLPRRAEYLRVRKERDDVIAIRANMERKGQHWPDWEELLARGETALRAEQEAAQRLADKLGEISNQCGVYENQITSAKKQVACEQALATYERETSKWRQRLDEALHNAVGWYLAGELESQEMEAGLPEVFQRARQRFAEFTDGRYELRLQRPNSFRTLDRVDQEERGLDQLSSATRVQLLMAVRLAFVEEREAGARLPLLMDEILASSDEAREQAIITVTLRICRTGRQVFYFTSKLAELALWQQHAGREGIELRVIDLADTPPARVHHALLPTPHSALPAPAGLSHTAYGEALGVPSLDFTNMSASAAHCWYVVEDNDRLYALLQANIRTCGQLTSPHLTELVDGLLGSRAGAQSPRAGRPAGEAGSLLARGPRQTAHFSGAAGERPPHHRVFQNRDPRAGGKPALGSQPPPRRAGRRADQANAQNQPPELPRLLRRARLPGRRRSPPPRCHPRACAGQRRGSDHPAGTDPGGGAAVV